MQRASLDSTTGRGLLQEQHPEQLPTTASRREPDSLLPGATASHRLVDGPLRGSLFSLFFCD